MSCPDRKTVERLRAEYPVGCRIVLDEMDDKQAPKIGTQGTCMGVDDAGSIMVSRDGITARVFQKNQWVRVNEYDAKGYMTGETYEGRWAELPKAAEAESTEDLKLSDEQTARNDEVYNAAYDFCKIMAEDENLEWNMEILGQLADFAAELLTGHGSKVRYPSVVTEPDGRQHIEEFYGVGD